MEKPKTIRAGHSNVFLSIDKPSEDTTNLAGIEIAIDTSYEPEKNARIFGTVIAVPFEDNIPPKLEEVDGRIVKRKVKMQLQEGDRAYYHYHVTSSKDQQGQYQNRIQLPDDSWVWLCDYSQVFVAVRFPSVPADMPKEEADKYREANKRIIPVNDKVLVLPIYDKKEQTETGIYIPEQVSGRYKADRGIVWKISERMDGKPAGFSEGDEVLFTKSSDFKNNIEGTECFVMEHEDIIGKVPFL